METEKHHEHNETQHDHAENPVHHSVEHHSEHHKNLPVKKNSTIMTLGLLALMIALLSILIFNQIQISTLKAVIGEKVADAAEASRPAKIQLTMLADSSCAECFSTDKIIAGVKATNSNITSEKTIQYNSEDGKSLVQKYKIMSIPTIIITGETDKNQYAGFIKEGDALVFQQPTPPYLDLDKGKVVGRVELTIISHASCKNCSDLTPLALQIKNAGVGIYKENKLDSQSTDAAELIKKYSIKKLPTILMSSDASYYQIIAQAWPSLGTVENDGTFVMRTINPPYYSVDSGKTEGFATVILLNDSSCKECYKVTDHMNILKSGFGMAIESLNNVDVSSTQGKELVKKYNISAVPTVLVSNADAYTEFREAWTPVGTRESDGTYIFRNFTVWPGHSYKNLNTGKVELNPVPTAK